MPVPQMKDTDAETNQPPAKKLRYSTFCPDIMSTRYGSSDLHLTHNQRSPEENGGECSSPIASLANLGNTCFLNSVLYTLRFAPSFLHKVHHLYTDSISLSKQLNAAKQDRACSLGRNLGKSGSWGNKEAFSNVTNDSDMKMQAFITNLHNLYASLWSNEYKDHNNMEPIQPLNFLHALREVNPIFHGNRQHDAHELLVCIVDAIREAYKIVYPQNSALERQPLRSPSSSTGDFSSYGGPNQETIFEDFQGVSLVRTKCLECEEITERKEPFCDICVPIVSEFNSDHDDAVDRLYQSVIVTEEFLVGCNKYWCAKCLRYNEAKSSVRFERVPKLLTLHLKRFSGFGASLSKVNDYMPTPFTLSCFCEKCLEAEQRKEKPPHKYYLYAMIMHLGASIASGHYVAYVKMLENSQDYLYCMKSKTSSLSRGYSINSMSQSSTDNSNSTQDKPRSTILRYLHQKLSSKSFSNGSNSGSSKDPDLRKERLKATCKGADCCSIKVRANASWLECDDAHIKPISIREIEHMLAKSNSNSGVTPYLLFYTKA